MKSGERFARDDTPANRPAPIHFLYRIGRWFQMNIDGRARASKFPIDVMKKARSGVSAIETRLMNAQKFQFARTRGGGGLATFQRDRFDLMHQAR